MPKAGGDDEQPKSRRMAAENGGAGGEEHAAGAGPPETPESEPSEWDDSDRELVQLCLDVVSEEDFTLFRRVTLDGWAYVDAAKAAGISLWACYKRVERTQKKLRRAIEEHPERFF